MNETGSRSISETIGRLIQCCAEQGRITHSIPGIAINAFPDGVAVKIGTNPTTGFTKEAARVLAETIRDLATGARKSGSIDMNHDFTAVRQGNGVRVSVPLTGEDKTFSVDLAIEFADLVQRAAK
jgi:hypothetical protein